MLGRPLATSEEGEQRVRVFGGIPMLGLDALSSAAYGPEAALTILLPLGAAGLAYFGPIILIILAILTVLYLSYRQTIAAYPTGGGSYTVARENLGTGMGLLAASALLVDYVLNVAVGISAGVEALVSAVPSLHHHLVALCLWILLLITMINLRGVKESGAAFALPTYGFVATLFAAIGIGVYQSLVTGGHPVPVAAPPALPVGAATASLWLLMRSFASGCTAMTGVEAVSNGVTIFANPGVKYAQRTLTWIVAILAALLIGIAYLCKAYHIGATNPEGASYQSVLSQLVAAVAGRGLFYYLTIGFVLAVLALSANTSYAGFPRLCRLLAQDDFLPHGFALRGRRLVFTVGIVILTLLAGALLVIFHGVTDRLIPLFAIGAFMAFTLSQAGMVVHWQRAKHRRARAAMLVNGVGAAATGSALAVVLAAKFVEGAWITVLLIPTFVVIFLAVRRHYAHVASEVRQVDQILIGDDVPPLVLVPVKEWNSVSEKAIRFAMKLSPDVIAAHIGVTEEEILRVGREWQRYVEKPLIAAKKTPPRLIALASPYRRLITPLIELVRDLEKEHPGRQIAIVIPELVENRWWQHLLHNQRASQLKAALLLHGDPQLIVINVPWYLGEAKFPNPP